MEDQLPATVPPEPKPGDVIPIPDSIAVAVNGLRDRAAAAEVGMQSLAETMKEAYVEMWEILKQYTPDVAEWKLSYNSTTKSVTVLRKLKAWEKENIEE